MRRISSLLTLAVVVAFIALISGSATGSDVCSDANGDGTVNISDAVYLITYIFAGGMEPQPLVAGDVNYDGAVNISDAVYMIAYIFASGPAPVCQRYTAPVTTTIIPQDSGTAILSYDTAGTVVLGESSVYAQGIAVGDIIIGQNDALAPNGFLRKVTSKTLQGTSIVLETEDATMAEAFEEMSINETWQLRPSDVRSAQLLDGVGLRAPQEGNTFSVSLNCVFYDQDGNLGTTNDQIRLSGEYSFTAVMFVVTDINWFTLRKFETGIQTNQTASVTLTSSLQWTLEEERTLAVLPLAPVPVGGVVWLTPTLTVKAYLDADLTITFVTGISYTQESRYGFGYANNAYYNIGTATKNFTYTPPQLTAEFNLEPAVSLDLACLIYGVAGPYAGGKLGLHFQSDLSADLCMADLTFDLNAILYATVGARCSILGQGFDYNSAFQIYSYPIGEWNYPLGGTIVINPEPNSLNAPWSITGPCNYSAAGDKTLANVYSGNYTMTWGNVSGWITPSTSTQALSSGQTITFNGTYTQRTVPIVTTTAVTAITSTTAQSGGTVTSDGGATVTARGVCWSTSPTPTVANNHTTDGSGTGSFTSSITGLSPSATYYVRAYAINSLGTGYGNVQSFTTPSPQPPTVTTIAVSNITSTSAQSGGNVMSDGGAAVTARGVCWSTGSTPTIADSKTSDGSGTGSFTSSITGLSPNTTYYVRAYATNSVGTGYGSPLQFTTVQVPIVATAGVINIAQTTAQSGGNVISEGGSTVAVRGVCWSTNSSPTTADSKTTDGSGLGSYTSSITGLSPNTTYYVRAYATSSVGTGYGSAMQFTTLPQPQLPVVTTNAVTGITSTSAQCGGTVTSDGGNPVTARGVCWSTSPSPTVANSHTTDGSGTGSFTSSIMGLLPNTTYYVKAYAINSIGTGYGGAQMFNTGDTANTVTDIDGNVYRTVTIGSQVWMAENLRVTHYRNGDAVSHIADSALWASGPAYGAYCEYNNDPSNVTTYGRLYNWYAGTDSRKIAPAGWHVPTSAEWQTLMDYLGGNTVAGGKMKEAGTTHWLSPNTGAVDSYGFTALPGGCRDRNGGWNYHYLGRACYFWTTSITPKTGWPIAIGSGNLTYDSGFCGVAYEWVAIGYSIRCVKD
jgi:uncharacterized protein (TIGR02145 family)